MVTAWPNWPGPEAARKNALLADLGLGGRLNFIPEKLSGGGERAKRSPLQRNDIHRAMPTARFYISCAIFAK